MLWLKTIVIISYLPGRSAGKESACNAGDPGSTPELGRSPGEGHGNPLQYSCLENPMDRGACRATVLGVTKGRTRLNNEHWLSLSRIFLPPQVSMHQEFESYVLIAGWFCLCLFQEAAVSLARAAMIWRLGVWFPGSNLTWLAIWPLCCLARCCLRVLTECGSGLRKGMNSAGRHPWGSSWAWLHGTRVSITCIYRRLRVCLVKISFFP